MPCTGPQANNGPAKRNPALIDDRPAVALLGPPQEVGGESYAETVAAQLAAKGYSLLLHGGGATPEVATDAALKQAGPVYRIVVAKDAPDASPGEGCTLVIRPSQLQCLEAVLTHADAVIALPGGVETMAIIMQIWSFGADESGKFRPIVLLGERWPNTIKALVEAAGLDRRDEMMISYATSPEEAVECLRYYAAP